MSASARDEMRIFQDTKPTIDQNEQDLREAFYHRMILAKRYSGRSNAEIARRSRSSESSVSSWFDARVKAIPEGVKMLQLPWALGVNGHWLITGEGPMVDQVGPGQQNQQAREAIARTEEFLRTLKVEVNAPHSATEGNRRHEEDRREA